MHRVTVPFLFTLLLAGPALGGWDEGVAAYRAGNFQAAVQEFGSVVAQSPDSSQAHFMLGSSLERLDRKEEALEHLRMAYDLDPNQISFQLELAKAYASLRRWDEAARLLDKIDPNSLPQTQRQVFDQLRATARQQSGDVQGALEDLAELARREPTNVDVQRRYAQAALQAGQRETALAAYGRASQLAPQDQDLRRAHVQLLVEAGRTARDKATKQGLYAEAAAEAAVLVAASPTYDDHLVLTTARLGAGLWGEAAESARGAIGRNGADWLPHFYLGQALTATEQYGEAEGALRAALERAPGGDDESQVLRQLGFVYEKQKRYADAIAAYERAGDQGSVARVHENEAIARENESIEAENAEIEAMEKERRRLEEELKALEKGGG